MTTVTLVRSAVRSLGGSSASPDDRLTCCHDLRGNSRSGSWVTKGTWLSLGIVFLLGTATIWVASLSTRGAQLPPEQLFGMDGARQRAISTSGITVQETAVMPGASLLISGPNWIGMAVVSSEALETTWVRETQTTWGPAGNNRAISLFYSADGQINQAVANLNDEQVYFEPARIAVPADPQPGQQWQDSGTAQIGVGTSEVTQVSFETSTTTRAATDPAMSDLGCLEFQRETKLAETLVTETEIRCPDTGLVLPEASDSEEFDALDVLIQDPVSQSDPTKWELTSGEFESEYPQAWVSTWPQIATNDVMVMPIDPSGDLVFATAADHSVRAHPGGIVTNLQRVGQLSIAATTQSNLVAYDLVGGWLWTAKLGDIATQDGAVLGNDLVVIDDSGQVTAVSLKSGEVSWQSSIASTPSSAPATCGDLAIVGSADGLTAFRDGEDVWQEELSQTPTDILCAADLDGEQVIVARAGAWLENLALDGEDLAGRIVSPPPGTTLVVLDDQVILASPSEVVAYDAVTLQVSWRQPIECSSAGISQHALLCLTPTELVALDGRGEIQQRWEMPEIPAESLAQFAITESGAAIWVPPMGWIRLK